MNNKNLTIGIDIGISSISIAIIDTSTKKILDAVVISLPQKAAKGQNDKEATKAFRREKRSVRTQLLRKGKRTKDLVRLIAPYNLLPLSAEKFSQNLKKEFPHKKDRSASSERRCMQEFFMKEPLALQKKAIRGETLDDLTDFGRILYAFAKRRGFPEAMRRNTSDAKGLTEGNIEEGKVGTNETEKGIRAQETYKYLPFYLASLLPDNKKPWMVDKRVRNHHTYRYMYVEAFLKIWEEQSKKEKFKDILTDDLKEKVSHTLFDQLPIKIPKRKKCTFEKDKPRAYKASLLFEEFRALKFINNLRFDEQPLSQEEKDKLSEFLVRKDFKIAALKKHLSKEYTPCNYDYEDKNNIVGMPVTHALQNLFEKKEWKKLTPAEKQARWDVIFQHVNMLNQGKTSDSASDATVQKKEPWIDRYAKEKWGFSQKECEKLNALMLPKGTCHLSEKAIKYILPYIKKGFTEADAFILGSVKKAFGHSFAPSSSSEKKPNYWKTLSAEEKEKIERDAIDILEKKSIPDQYHYQQEKRPIENLIAYLKQTYPQKAYLTDAIYHHSDHAPKELAAHLPPPPPINQPVVAKIIHQLHRSLNALITKHDIQEPTIWVEMARDLKTSPEKAEKIQLEQNKNRAKNFRIHEELVKNRVEPDAKNIMKYRLWAETKYQCVYTGKSIGFDDIFKKKEFDLEHIVPRQPKDTRMINMTLSCRSKNQEKGNRTPFQAFGHNKEEWDRMKQRADELLPYRKYQRFVLEQLPDEPFLQSDRDVTGYIAKETGKYLRHITSRVHFTQGRITSMMAKQWGLNRYLSPILRMPPKENSENAGICSPEFSAKHAYEVGHYYIAVEKGDHDHVIPYNVIAYSRFCPNTVTKKEQKIANVEVKVNQQLSKLAELNKKKKEKGSDTKTIEAEVKAIKEVLKSINKEEIELQKSIQKQEAKAREDLKKVVKQTLKKSGTEFNILSGTIKKKASETESPVYIFIPENRKNRDDHRHHLVDALTIASLKLDVVNKINRQSAQDEDIDTAAFPPPWEGFAKDVKKCLQSTLVQNKKKDKLMTQKLSCAKGSQIPLRGDTAQGQLHKATYYGRCVNPIDGEIYFHHRVPIEKLREASYTATIKRAQKIADPVIRRTVIEKLTEDQQAYYDQQRKANPTIKESDLDDKVQGNPFFTEVKEDKKLIRRTPNIFLTSKKDPSAKIPVLRIRLQERRTTLRRLSPKQGTNRYVDTGKNYCIGFYEERDKKGKAKWVGSIIPFWDAVERKRKKESILPDSHEKKPLVFNLKQNDMVLIDLLPEDRGRPSLLDPQTISEHLYRVKNIAQSGQFHLIKHTAAGENSLDTVSCKPDTFRKRNPVKVILDKTGAIKHYILPKGQG